jgi:alkanesulfonate monooxygenase SsuD/methylene tetrahydromethanopterin reductase-like flavin-dependent oxidoreductase (luciferase family)
MTTGSVSLEPSARPYPPHADPALAPLEHCVPRALPREPRSLMLGIFQPNQSWSFWPTTATTETSWTYRYNRDVVRLAEAIGLHFAFPAGRWKGIAGDSIDWRGASFDTVTLTAGLLEATSRITLLTTIHTNVFNPVVAAKMGADLDHIGNGRWGLNIVSGWGVEEFGSMGIPLLNHADRYRYTSEWLSIIRELWEHGECTHQGEYFTIDEAVARPRPMQSPRPLIVNAGQSNTGLRFAAREADYLFSGAGNAERYRRLCAEDGLDGGIIGTIKILVRETTEAARELASDIADHADRGAIRGMMIASGGDTPETADEKLASKEQVRGRVIDGAVIGSPDEVAGELAERALGADLDGFCLTFFDYQRDLTLFAERVIPVLREKLLERGVRLRLTLDEPGS